MLLEFTIGNFLSFKERRTLQFVASAAPAFEGQLLEAGGYQLLRTVALLGANGSGKSNLLTAMTTMQHLVIKPSEMASPVDIEVKPYLLSTETESAPSFFEVVLVIHGVRYRYGFETNQKAITTEWLFANTTGPEERLFNRNGTDIELGQAFVEGRGIRDKTRDSRLFLSECDRFNGPVAGWLIEWFSSWRDGTTVRRNPTRTSTHTLLNDPLVRPHLLNFMNEELDLGNIVVQQTNTGSTASSIHDKFDATGQKIGTVELNLPMTGSAATNHLFALAGPLYHTLTTGGLLIVDDFSERYHSLLSRRIILFFSTPMPGFDRGQLVFSTHDLNVPYYAHLRRDQIFCVEKDQYGVSRLGYWQDTDERAGN